MKAEKFVSAESGRLVPTIEGELAFVPAALPPKLDLGEIAVPMAEAMQAIGELKGACRRLASPFILIRPLQRQEALTSSAMEGTFTTADNLVLAEAGLDHQKDDSTREVVNYLRALNEALEMLEKLPISHRVIRKTHEILLSGLSAARGAQKRPGEYKTEQNWIGGRTIQTARFVPPPAKETTECMDELERHINREGIDMPTRLIDLALVHYQIETIHPFADGNGRVGRMLISLMAVQSGLLEMPVLYISPAMERDKDTYIDLMFNVSAQGEWVPWLRFFFSKICEACQETVAIIDRLIELQERYRELAANAMRTANILTLVDMLFEVPAISVVDAEKKLNLTYAAARKLIDKLVEVGILIEVPGFYPKTFLAPAIIRAVRPAAPPKEDGRKD